MQRVIVWLQEEVDDSRIPKFLLKLLGINFLCYGGPILFSVLFESFKSGRIWHPATDSLAFIFLPFILFGYPLVFAFLGLILELTFRTIPISLSLLSKNTYVVLLVALGFSIAELVVVPGLIDADFQLRKFAPNFDLLPLFLYPLTLTVCYLKCGGWQNNFSGIVKATSLSYLLSLGLVTLACWGWGVYTLIYFLSL